MGFVKMFQFFELMYTHTHNLWMMMIVIMMIVMNGNGE